MWHLIVILVFLFHNSLAPMDRERLQEPTNSPLQNALDYDNARACIELLQKGCCTNICNGILDSPYPAFLYAMDANKIKCIETLICSKKMCLHRQNCSHNNSVYWIFSLFSKSYDSKTYNNATSHDITITALLQQYCKYLSTPQRYAYFTYIQKRAMILSLLASPTKTSFNEKWKYVSKQSTYLYKTFVTFAQWASDPKRDLTQAKNHVQYIFMCPAFSDEFKLVLAQEILFNVITEIDAYGIKNALIAQSTDSLIALLYKLLANNSPSLLKKGYCPVEMCLIKINDGIQNHMHIWPDYAYDMQSSKTSLHKMYRLRQEYFCTLLAKHRFSDVHFSFQ